MANWIRLSSGKYVNLSAFSTEDVDLGSINKALNTIVRFTGHSKDEHPLTVAQHTELTILVAQMLKLSDKVVLDCIIHDFPEAYYNDIASPVKRLMGDEYRKVADNIDAVVYKALWPKGVEYDEETKNLRHWCDLISLDIERHVLWKDQGNVPTGAWPTVDNPFDPSEFKRLFDYVADAEIDLENVYKNFVKRFTSE